MAKLSWITVNGFNRSNLERYVEQILHLSDFDFLPSLDEEAEMALVQFIATKWSDFSNTNAILNCALLATLNEKEFKNLELDALALSRLKSKSLAKAGLILTGRCLEHFADDKVGEHLSFLHFHQLNQKIVKVFDDLSLVSLALLSDNPQKTNSFASDFNYYGCFDDVFAYLQKPEPAEPCNFVCDLSKLDF